MSAKKTRITQGELPAILYGLDVNFYEQRYFFSNDGKMRLGFFCDKLTDVLKAKLAAIFPQASIFNSSPEYAPEIKRSVIIFPRKTQLYMMKD